MVVMVVGLVLAQSTGGSLLFPERRSGVVSLSADAAVFASLLPQEIPQVIEYRGVGVIGELAAAWHAPAPFALRARAFPLHVSGDLRGGRAWLGGGALLEALLDLRFFAVGLGGGFGTFEVEDATALVPLLTGVLRLGALDGLQLQARVHFRMLGPTGQLWLSGLEATAQVPLVRGWWLSGGARFILDAGVGDVGVRASLSPSMFLSTRVGLGLTRIGLGPSLAVGIEYRL